MQNGSGLPDTRHLTYLDFELEIGLGSGREYPIVVVRSPAGEARETLRFPFDEPALESRLKDLQIALLRSGGNRRQMLSPEERAVQEFGRTLFDSLVVGEVRSRYDVSQREATGQGRGLRLKLRIQPPELAALPWEYLYDSRQAEYVCLSRNTPVVRYMELPQPILPLTVTPPLRILGMVASPNDLPLLDVTREKQRVENAIQALRASGLVELTWLEGQTWRDLQRAMRAGPWHVFHFIGHGGYDRQTEEGCIALADEEGQASRLSATQLGRLLADHRSLRMVLLNACEGARGSEHDIFSSAAAILVRRGIPAVLAMQYEITDRAAIEFARTFYEALTDEMPVDEAVTEARKAISMMVANTVEWGTPVLYMRSPDGMLFNLREQAQLAQAARRAQEEAERLERERIERVAQEKAARERAVQEARRRAKEKTERQARLAVERAEAERLERERQECEIQRLEQEELECAERERSAQLEADSRPAPAAPPIENKLATSAPFASDMPLSLEVVQQQWSSIFEVLKIHSLPMLVALMRYCKPMSIEGNTLVLNWPTEMMRSKYEDIRTKQLVEEIISEAVGVHVVTQCVVSDEAKLAAERAGAERLEQERLEREKAAREEAERQAKLAAEKAEAERKAREKAAKEADRQARLAAEKAEAERVAQEQAAKEEAERQARLAAEKAEAERLEKERQAREAKAKAAKEEVDKLARLAAAKAEAERLEQERQEREAKDKAAKEETDRQVNLAAEKAEAERLQRERREQESRMQAAREAERRARQAAVKREPVPKFRLPAWAFPAAGGALVVALAVITCLVGSVIVNNAANSAATQTAIAARPTMTATLPATRVPTITPLPPSTSTLTAGATRIVEKDGMVMVYVPAGEFLMGSSDSDTRAQSGEKPQHKVYMDAFWIDRTEVTNAQYKKCVQANPACKASSYASDSSFNGDNQPVVGVDWNDAHAYCEWAGRQLPTEAQWEKAARGTDGRIYPWGNQVATCEYAVMDDGSGNGCGKGDAAWAVGSKPKGVSPYGALDMAGNVWEWVADWYDEKYYDSSSAKNPNPQGPMTGQYHVLRGGSWFNVSQNVRTALRGGNTPDLRLNFVGFRCSR